MALSQTFSRKCSVSGPTCTNSINSCSTTACTQYCGTNVCSTATPCNQQDYYSNSYYCSTYYEYIDYYETSSSYSDSYSCEVHCPTYNNSCYQDDGQGPGYRNQTYNNYSNICSNYSESSCNNLSCKEYYNYSNQKNNSYSNCQQYSYYNYANQYHNSSYYEYGNYKNSNNYCSTSWTYYNYADAYATKLGGSYTPSWSNSVPSSDSVINNVFLKELRDKVKQLSTTKQRNQVNDTNINSGSGTSSDSNINKYVRLDNLAIENIRSTLNSIYSELGQTVPNISSIGDETKLTPSILANIKNAVDELAKKDISSSYVNYLNSSYSNSSSSYVNMANIPSSIITYTNSNVSSYKNYSESTSNV